MTNNEFCRIWNKVTNGKPTIAEPRQVEVCWTGDSLKEFMESVLSLLGETLTPEVNSENIRGMN